MSQVPPGLRLEHVKPVLNSGDRPPNSPDAVRVTADRPKNVDLCLGLMLEDYVNQGNVDIFLYSENKCIGAHRKILDKYFKRFAETSKDNKDGRFEIEGAQFECIRHVLNLVYFGSVIVEPSEIPGFLKVIRFLQADNSSSNGEQITTTVTPPEVIEVNDNLIIYIRDLKTAMDIGRNGLPRGSAITKYRDATHSDKPSVVGFLKSNEAIGYKTLEVLDELDWKPVFGIVRKDETAGNADGKVSAETGQYPIYADSESFGLIRCKASGHLFALAFLKPTEGPGEVKVLLATNQLPSTSQEAPSQVSGEPQGITLYLSSVEEQHNQRLEEEEGANGETYLADQESGSDPDDSEQRSDDGAQGGNGNQDSEEQDNSGVDVLNANLELFVQENEEQRPDYENPNLEGEWMPSPASLNECLAPSDFSGSSVESDSDIHMPSLVLAPYPPDSDPETDVVLSPTGSSEAETGNDTNQNDSDNSGTFSVMRRRRRRRLSLSSDEDHNGYAGPVTRQRMRMSQCRSSRYELRPIMRLP